jgi:hypothetical protein
MRGAIKTGLAWSFAGAGMLTILLSGGPAFGVVNDPDPPTVEVPTTDMKSGLLTSKQDKAAGINGQDHAFHLKIVFADDTGRVREWKEFKKGDHVQYHLKQGQIDFLLLELPK